ncbi:MATE family efflux transporter [Clostridium sp. MSJ-8]|uniref:MATE family efflux transporter n=1 Tax=Clostridium sp. MSJ-8 TaxID=2841510 RepID=UPI001C0EDACF|nr:MATE family efflux transporter [Clostridium sp. MSJ-8]MBU5486923.1 MATE family efflux transporter [Clostridium sp. MSJ-8]
MEAVSKNKMGEEPIKSLMLKMGIPMIISMVLQAVYNIVDSYFVSCMKDSGNITGIGEYGVNALTLAFPIQMLIVAVGVGTGVGINALLARSLGQGDREKASKIAGNAIFLGICMYIVFLLFGIFGVNLYIKSQTSDPIVIDMAQSYLSICTILSFGVILYTIYEKLLQGTGKTTLCTIAQIIGAVTNIILDPIFIFGYFGLPEMGIKGAAYATVIGQMVSFILDCIFHYKYNKDIDASFKYIKPEKKIIGQIYKVGLPAIIMQALMSIMTYGVNIIFGIVSGAAVTAYGVYYKIQQFVFFAAFGLNNAIIPIVSFNYGMRDKERVQEGIKYGIIYTLIIMAIGLVGLQLFANQLIGIFTLSKETHRLCILSIRIVTLGYLFAGANIAYQGIFQALDSGLTSLVVSLLRLIIIALPLAYIFTKLNNATTIIWTSFPIAEGVAMIIAIFIMKALKRDKVDNLLEK